VTTVAVIYDQVDFINGTYGSRINSIPTIETMLRYVVVCLSVETLKHLLNSDDLSKFTAVYKDGKTLLHFATLGSSKPKTEYYLTHSCPFSACVCPNMAGSDVAEEKRLETVMLLTKVLVSDINKRDKYGRTALHYATVQIFPNIVEYLVNAGADRSINDQLGYTAFEFALQKKTFLCRQQMWSHTIFDKMGNHLLQNANIKNCDVRAKNLLSDLLYNRMTLSLYAVFNSGLDVNCAQEHFKRLLYQSVYKQVPNGDIFELFKNFQINVKVVCDVPFAQSELHLMAYLTMSTHSVGNLFQPSVNGTPFPLQRFIESHPKGVELLNECYDKEGYLAIHRAVQGANLDAVSWFIKIGASISRKTKSYQTLALAIYPVIYLEEYSHYKGRIVESLLENMPERIHAAFAECKTERADVSVVHLVGCLGMRMLKMFYRGLPAFPLKCTNSDGIKPIYLAYLHFVE
jgi:ankyrin repeat protein